MIGALKNFTTILQLIGFNSGKYDLYLIKKHLVEHLVPTNKGINNDTTDHCYTSAAFVILCNVNFMCLTLERLTNFDIINYLAPDFNYEKYLKVYGCMQTTGFFPYEWMTSLHKLDCETIPPKEAFHIKLKNEDITAENYDYCKNVWRDHDI